MASPTVALCMCIVVIVLASSHAGNIKKDSISDNGGDLTGAEFDDLSKYGILLDAGSSGTKLNIYIITPASGASELPTIKLQYNQKFPPGISDVEDVETYLKEVLDVAKEKIPVSQQSVAHIFLKATAGLRFMTAGDATSLVQKVQGIFENKGINPFTFKPADIQVLSGEEEGVYAWVAANYLLGFFSGNKPDSEAVGLLEMGGGSTQITFIPKEPLYDGEFQVFVGGRKFELYVHSYLQYGINAVNTWIAEVLSESSPGQTTLDDPCMLRDDSSDVDMGNGTIIQLKGSGDPELCKKVMTTILTPVTDLRCQPKPCAIGTVYQPDVDGINFYATQGFTYAPDTFKAFDDNITLSLEKLQEAATIHCKRSVDESVAVGIKKSIASSSCLLGVYEPTLFTVSYGFDINTKNIKVTSNIGEDSIDWALGSMVIEMTGNSVRRRR